MRYPFLFFLLLIPLLTHASDVTGTVTKVWDGDSFIIKSKQKQLEIRLAHIDAPEKDQTHGEKAKQFLQTLLLGKKITIKPVTKDRYRRTVAYAYLDDLNLNYKMVKEGHAWVYRKYAKDPQLMLLEVRARINQRGLWKDDKPTPPWQWRREHRRRN